LGDDLAVVDVLLNGEDQGLDGLADRVVGSVILAV
jgi:hypothetical protein